MDEVVTTLLFNFIMALFVSYLLEGPMKDPLGMGWPKSAALTEDARLPRLAEGLRLHWGFGVALIAARVVWICRRVPRWGSRCGRWGLMWRLRALRACR